MQQGDLLFGASRDQLVRLAKQEPASNLNKLVSQSLVQKTTFQDIALFQLLRLRPMGDLVGKFILQLLFLQLNCRLLQGRSNCSGFEYVLLLQFFCARPLLQEMIKFLFFRWADWNALHVMRCKLRIASKPICGLEVSVVRL